MVSDNELQRFVVPDALSRLNAVNAALKMAAEMGSVQRAKQDAEQKCATAFKCEFSTRYHWAGIVKSFRDATQEVVK